MRLEAMNETFTERYTHSHSRVSVAIAISQLDGLYVNTCGQIARHCDLSNLKVDLFTL